MTDKEKFESDIAKLERQIQYHEDIITNIRNTQAEIQTRIDTNTYN